MAENINLTIAELNEAISELTADLGQCCTSKGQSIESPPSDGNVPVGPDEQFPDQAAYFLAKCSAANAIYDTVKGKVDWLRNNNVDLLAGVLGGVTTAVALGLLLSGPVGWAIELAAVTVIGLSTYLISHAIDFEDLQNALADVHDELVTALYNSSDTNTARTSFLTELDASTVPTTAIEAGLIQVMLSSDLLNLLFEPRADVATYESPSPIDCGTAILALWTFPTDEEGWTFRDDSAGASSASGAYNSGDQALEITMVNAGGGSKPISKGTWLKTGLSQAVPSGSSLQFDYSKPSDDINQSKHAKIIYSDMTESNHTVTGGTTAGTLVMTLPVAKTITDIECSISRTTSLTNSHTSDILEVRVIGT